MKTLKAISYAYPTSDYAKQLGFYDIGCWHICLEYYDIEGSGQCGSFLPHDAIGFLAPDDPDLIALFHEYDAVIDPIFLKYGNPKALKAISK